MVGMVYSSMIKGDKVVEQYDILKERPIMWGVSNKLDRYLIEDFGVRDWYKVFVFEVLINKYLGGFSKEDVLKNLDGIELGRYYLDTISQESAFWLDDAINKSTNISDKLMCEIMTNSVFSIKDRETIINLVKKFSKENYKYYNIEKREGLFPVDNVKIYESRLIDALMKIDDKVCQYFLYADSEVAHDIFKDIIEGEGDVEYISLSDLKL